MDLYWKVFNGVVCAGIGYFGYVFAMDRIGEVNKIRKDLDDFSEHLSKLNDTLDDTKNDTKNDTLDDTKNDTLDEN
jgi:hypothetical protein